MRGDWFGEDVIWTSSGRAARSNRVGHGQKSYLGTTVNGLLRFLSSRKYHQKQSMTRSSLASTVSSKARSAELRWYKGTPASLNDRSRASIRDITRPYEKTFQDFSYGAFLDVTAVNVISGQAVWFYKSGVCDLDRLKKPITFLAESTKIDED